MHHALLLVAAALARAHDTWLVQLGRRRTLVGRVASLDERVARLEAENALLHSRFPRVPGRRRPHYRPHERMEILWHATRYRLSVQQTTYAFALSVQTVVNWRRVSWRRDSHLLPPPHGLLDLVHEFVHR